MYKYEISVTGSGCECVIGTIPQTVSAYWQMKKEEYLYEHLEWYLTDFVSFENEHYVPDMYKIEQEHWNEIDDILHTNGCNVNGTGYLEVTDADTNKVVFSGDLCDIVTDNNIISTDNLKCADVPKDMSLFYAWTEEKMWCNFNVIETKTPFDINKLKFHTDYFKGDDILHTLEYEGEEVEHCGGEGYTKCLNMDIAYWGKTDPIPS